MKNIFKLMVLAMLPITMVGCGAIDTNNAGVRTTWDNQIEEQSVGAGFYVATLSSVDEWVGKEIMIELDNMTPKAGDNLTMEDLDVEVYYQTDVGAFGPILKGKYANAHVKVDGYVYPAYKLVEAQAREAVYKAASKLNSLDIHKNRKVLSEAIQSNLQEILNNDDKGVFIVTKVIIKQAKTDSTLEKSIQIAIKKEKELEAKRKEVQIKEQEALANDALAASLSPNIMRLRELDAMVDACKNNTCIIDFTNGTGVQPLINMPAKR